MTLIAYKPNRSTILNDMDFWMDRFWGLGDTFESSSNSKPVFNIYENRDSYFISADLPGVNKKDVDITISDDSISIKGERKPRNTDSDVHQNYDNISFGAFEKSFSIPDDVNTQKVDAEMVNGVLTLEIKKAKKVDKNIKKISIK